MATAMVNGGPSAEGSSSGTTMVSTGKQQPKPAGNAGSKPTDLNRKQAGHIHEGAQKRNVPQKAWTSGMNPITQRSTTSGQQNGVGSQAKNNAHKIAINQEANMEKLPNERLMYLLANFMGLTATVTLKNGEMFSGIFFGASMENNESSFILKMVQQIRTTEKSEVNGAQDDVGAYFGVGEDHTTLFDTQNVADLAVEGVGLGAQEKYRNGSTAGFRTDTDISGNLAFRERQLQRWTSTADTDVDLSLEGSGSGGTWDQFKANEQLFGLKSDYDENIYTTRIDRSNPSYREREAAAIRLAQDIEERSTSNAHIREERGMVDEDGGLDEEEKYSGVRRQGVDYPPLQSSQSNRYMPPARRPPSGKPTVAGAPVDPAIISSQIARSDASPQRQANTALRPAENSAASAASGDAKSQDAKKEAVKDISTGKVVSASTPRPADTSKAPTPNATANVEAEVLDSFRNFAMFEKNRLADDRRKRVSHDKAIKLNDLKKFSTNFKLHTPVPKDLVPILAKDTAKQHEIVEKAQREAEQKTATPPKTLASSADQPSTKGPAESKQDGTRAPPNATERQEYTNFRPGFPPRDPQAGMLPREKQPQFPSMFPSAQNGQGLLSHRLADNHGRHRGGMPVSIPTPLPIQGAQKPPRPIVNAVQVPNSQASSTVRTPTSAASAKFNVFKPNPAANTFKPTGMTSAASSPRSNAARPMSRAPSPSEFFGTKKPLPSGETHSILDSFNPLKRLREKAQKEGKAKDYAANGGIVYAHATPVTWTQVKSDENFKSYKDMYEDAPPASRGVSPQHSTASPVNPALLHQLPAHLQHAPQGMPHLQAPQQVPYPGPPQPHHFPGVPHHYDEHRMHPSPSQSSAYSTPRVQGPYLAYPPPMGQLPYGYSQPAPPHIMGHGAPQQGFRPVPGGPPYGQSPGQQFSAPMMVHNSSQGSFMGPHGMPGPQMPIFAPGQVAPYGGQSQPPSGFPSPGRATPMIHQGSFQGQYVGNQQYGTPIYAQQPPQHSKILDVERLFTADAT
ncbi:MAG: hypothetical protein ASARMPRED_004182 [Alectoria sarmentosa]|nr:MAG: hypothetical protein ASARMPRED_004182 [Alectoria sarmentosa]